MVLFEDTGVPLPEVNIEVLPEPTEKLTVLLYQEPVFSLSIPAQADYLLIGADASVVGDSQTLPNGMGQICWLSKTWLIRRKVLVWTFSRAANVSLPY